MKTLMIRNLFGLAALALTAFAADVPLTQLVPADAKVIGGIHVDRTAGSPFGQFVLSRINENDKGLQEIIAATGFDPRRDLREIVVASNGEPKGPGVVLALGVFNGPQILAAIRTKTGASVTTYNGVDILEGQNGKGGRALAFVEGSLAIAGEPSLVRAVIDRRSEASASGALGVKAFTASGQYDAWMVTSGLFVPPLPTSGRQRTPLPTASLQGIVETSGGLTFGSVVRFSGEALTRSQKDAQALVDVVRFLGSMIQMDSSNPDFQKLQPIFDSLDVKAEGSTVRLSFAIPQSDLEKLVPPQRRTVRAAR